MHSSEAYECAADRHNRENERKGTNPEAAPSDADNGKTKRKHGHQERGKVQRVCYHR